jgi:hypothetical protein
VRISILLKCAAIALAAAGNTLPQATPERIDASPENGFHHDYFLLLPEKLKDRAPFLIASPTPKTSDDAAEFYAAAERIARNVVVCVKFSKMVWHEIRTSIEVLSLKALLFPS